MSSFNEPEEKLIQVIDCVADIDDYPLEKSDSIDSEGKPRQKVVLVTGGAGIRSFCHYFDRTPSLELNQYITTDF